MKASPSRKSKHLRSFLAIKVSKSEDLAPGPMFISLTDEGLVPERLVCPAASLVEEKSKLWRSKLVLDGVCAAGTVEGYGLAAAGSTFSPFSSSSSSRMAVSEVRGVPVGLSYDGDLAYEILLCRLACADLPSMLLLPALLRRLDEAEDGDAADEPGEAMLLSSCEGVADSG